MRKSETTELFSRWHTYSSAPHRMFFFGGAMQALLTIAWWLADLGGRYGGYYPPIAWTIPPVDAHAFLMVYGFFPFFVFGFLMTTYPRWMNGEEVERRHYVSAFLLLALGTVLFYAGLIAGKALVTLALRVFLAGWGMGLYALLRVIVRARHPDKRHAIITSVVLVLGWLLLAGFLSGKPALVALARTAGVWVFLLPVFFAVSHRMIPFFSANVIPDYQVIRPNWALALVPTGALLHAMLDLNGLPGWTWLVDVPMAASAFYLSRAWQLRSSLSVPILGMLHIGFAWLGIALTLFAIQSLWLLVNDQLLLARAPLHALVIGYFASMLFAMITRVTLGHSGRGIRADKTTWAVFLTLQSVVVLRILSELPGLDFEVRGHLYVCAALVWLACFGLWCYKFAPIYWRPRADGQPG